MTCIAYDGETLAADKGIIRGELVTTYIKIHVVKGHRGKFMLGLCGPTAFLDRVVDYFNSPFPVEYPDLTKYEKNYSDSMLTFGLAISEDRKCRFLYGDGTFSAPTRDIWGTDGSGCAFVGGALAAGVTAEHAIQLAIAHTNCAFLGVDVLHHKDVFQ